MTYTFEIGGDHNADHDPTLTTTPPPRFGPTVPKLVEQGREGLKRRGISNADDALLKIGVGGEPIDDDLMDGSRICNEAGERVGGGCDFGLQDDEPAWRVFYRSLHKRLAAVEAVLGIDPLASCGDALAAAKGQR